MIKYIAILLLVGTNCLAQPAPGSRETEWSKYLSGGNDISELKGVAEYTLFDKSRVDILSEKYAVEVEWASKWKESIGQALFYAALTDKKPAIVLLSKNTDYERLCYLRLMVVANKYDIKVFVVEIKDVDNH